MMSIQPFYPVQNSWFYFLVIVVLEAMAVYTWQFRKMPGAQMAAYAQAGKCVVLFTLLLIGAEATIEDKAIWIQLQKLAMMFLPYVWFHFTLQLSQQEKVLPWFVVRGVNISFYLMALVTVVNWRGVTWQHVWMDGSTVWIAGGPQYAAWYGYALAILTTALAVRWVVAAVGLRRRQALWYFCAVLISWGSHAVWKFSGWKIQALPWGFLLNGLIVTWIYYRWQLYNILPLAQDIAARNVIEGLLIVDEQGYIVDMNPAATQMLEGLPAVVGGELNAAMAAWPALAAADGGRDGEVVAAERAHGGKIHYYELKRIPLQTSKRNVLGRIILLTDITEQKMDHERVVEQEKSVATMAERANLARELHDNLCQVLGYVNVQSQSLRMLAADGRMSETVAGLQRLTDAAGQAYDDVREYIQDVQMTKQVERGFVSALQDYIAQLRLTQNMEVELATAAPVEQQLPQGAQALQLLRIVQEAVNNACKHAAVDRLWIEIVAEKNAVRITVRDAGKGFSQDENVAKQGFGLTTMRERAAKIGAELDVRSCLGQGTSVSMRIPLLTNPLINEYGAAGGDAGQ